ncbi:MAG: T9SS type A sorting domain-containing protein [Bacteroidia bacterium]
MKTIQILPLFLFALFPSLLFSQGKLVMTGGGNIYGGGWSEAPFQWAIQQASNHRLAILRTTYPPENQEDYYLSLGAEKARYFVISFPSLANHRPLIDTLMQYDFWLLEGENALDTYSLYKSTRVDSAMRVKFREGGVIGANGNMASLLSDIIFTAPYGDIESHEAIRDLADTRIQLKNDFLPFMEGYVIDPFLSEKRRFGRLITFMARWWLEKKDPIAGLGIDEQTALCIDASGNGQVMGTGAVTILLNDISQASFKNSNGSPTIDSLQMIQLLDGDVFNLVSWETRTNGIQMIPPVREETLGKTMLFSAGTSLSDTDRFLDTLIFGSGYDTDPILIVTSESGEYAPALKAVLESRGAPRVGILRTTDLMENDFSQNTDIPTAGKILFTQNDPIHIQAFLKSGVNGPLLHSRIWDAETVVAFMGEDCQLAGPWLLASQQVRAATLSPEDETLIIQPGLGLLQTTTIVPEKDFGSYFSYITTGIPFLMVSKALTYGITIPEGSFVKYFSREMKTAMVSYGPKPVMLLHHAGGKVRMPEYVSPESRNSTGFERLTLSVLDSMIYPLGKVASAAHQIPEENSGWFSVFPNPVGEDLNILLAGNPSGTFTFQLINSEGQNIVSRTVVIRPGTPTLSLPLPVMAAGVYVLLVKENGSKIIQRIQVIH